MEAQYRAYVCLELESKPVVSCGFDKRQSEVASQILSQSREDRLQTASKMKRCIESLSGLERFTASIEAKYRTPMGILQSAPCGLSVRQVKLLYFCCILRSDEFVQKMIKCFDEISAGLVEHGKFLNPLGKELIKVGWLGS